MLRTVQSLPQEWAFDTGLRPRPFPDEAASLLPGPLAATRTGLTPASDDELTTQDHPPTRSTSCLWAHGKGSVSDPAPRGGRNRALATGLPLTLMTCSAGSLAVMSSAMVSVRTPRGVSL